MAAVMVLGVAMCYFSVWYILVGIIVAAILNDLLPWRRNIKKELKKRKDEYTTLQSRFYASIEEHNQPAEFKAYGDASRKLTSIIEQFKNLPHDIQTKKREAEERLYNQQLQIFLSRFYVRDHNIPNFGDTRKKLLYNNGVLNAADISKLHTTKIQGIGPAYMQVLLSWQRQVSSTFVYMPDNELLNRQFAIITAGIAEEKKKLENSIRGEFQSFQFIKQSILNKQAILRKQAETLHVKVAQAEADYEGFKKAVG